MRLAISGLYLALSSGVLPSSRFTFTSAPGQPLFLLAVPPSPGGIGDVTEGLHLSAGRPGEPTPGVAIPRFLEPMSATVDGGVVSPFPVTMSDLIGITMPPFDIGRINTSFGLLFGHHRRGEPFPLSVPVPEFARGLDVDDLGAAQHQKRGVIESAIGTISIPDLGHLE